MSFLNPPGPPKATGIPQAETKLFETHRRNRRSLPSEHKVPRNVQEILLNISGEEFGTKQDGNCSDKVPEPVSEGSGRRIDKETYSNIAKHSKNTAKHNKNTAKHSQT